MRVPRYRVAWNTRIRMGVRRPELSVCVINAPSVAEAQYLLICKKKGMSWLSCEVVRVFYKVNESKMI